MFTVLVLFYAGLVRLGHAAYSLQHDYDSRNWVDMFHFDTVRARRLEMATLLNLMIV